VKKLKKMKGKISTLKAKEAFLEEDRDNLKSKILKMERISSEKEEKHEIEVEKLNATIQK
jgi:hypothetical protein